MKGKPTTLPPILSLAHQFLSRAIRPGAFVVDATAGNGHDTVFLAEEVGPSGHVYAFDIQPEAIESTRTRVSEHGFGDRVTLLPMSHSLIESALPSKLKGSLSAIVFNLGYLPSSDKSVITEAATTLQALRDGTQWLASGGVIVCVIYTGHSGGAQEAEAIEGWSSSLDSKCYRVYRYQLTNVPTSPPYLLAVEKL